MWRWCHFGCMKARLYFLSSKNPGRKEVEKKSCMSNLLLFSKLEQFGKEAWKVSCETTSLGGSMPQRKTLIFLCKLPCWWIFFIAWVCAGTLHGCFLRLGAYYWLVGIHLALYERLWGAFNHNPLIRASAKAQDSCELCVGRGCFEASACVSQIVWGEGACIWICCLVNWGTGWGNMHVGKYFLCAFLSSRGFLTSVPVGCGAAQRSCTWVSSCEHTSEGPLKKKKKEGKLKTDLM